MNLPEVRRVYLEDFPPQTKGMLGLISLIVCPPAQVADLSRSLAEDEAPPLPTEEWLDLLETILIYKLPKLTREEIKQMLGIQDVELKKTRFYQDVFSEGKLEGRLEGKLEGKQEGKLEGRIAEAQALLSRLLIKRFGPLGEPARRRIELATIEQLEHWADNILEAKTLSAVFDGH